MPAAAVHSIKLRKENAHDDSIYCCAWTKLKEPAFASKDFLMTGGLDSLLKVWSLENNRLELFKTFVGHALAVVSVAVSPDGHSIASTSLDSTLIIWDLLSGQKVHEIETGAIEVWKVVFSPDGTQVATGGHNGKVIICGIMNGTTDKILDTRGNFALSVAWSPNGKYIACGAVDGVVSVFDVAQAKLMHTIEAHRRITRGMAFSPNSKFVVSASDDGFVKVFNVVTGALQGSMKNDSWAVRALVSPDGSRLAVAAGDGSVQVLAFNTLEVLATFEEHTDTAWDIAFSTKGDKLFSISKDRCIIIYDCPEPPKTVTKKYTQVK